MQYIQAYITYTTCITYIARDALHCIPLRYITHTNIYIHIYANTSIDMDINPPTLIGVLGGGVGGPRQAPKGGTLSHLAYWNLLHKILDVAAQ